MKKTNVEDKIYAAFRNAKASLEIEGQTLPEGGEELILNRVRGKISEQDFLKQALDIAKR